MQNKVNSFVIADHNKCVGCKLCEVACSNVHSKDGLARKTISSRKGPIIPRIFVTKIGKVKMPIQCRHCEDMPCGKVCPVNAIKKVDNKVLLDERVCIGCKTCAVACPFGAIEMTTIDKDTENERTIALKCDLCVNYDSPACVKVCPKDALRLVNPKEEENRKREEVAKTLINVVKGL